ncbi:hypothetical protein Taro_031912 [Colocasia esculenta]|uniref:Uncharacterized protein n=1 Tax=Colocasia esculenta TaxID=4460 RepID=A0A843VQ25_COLES|nr:hypothetical protein [Colocasia esculenta]
MAAPMISGSVGGYSAEFLSPKEQERFTFVKTKICENKAVDVQNLEKKWHGEFSRSLEKDAMDGCCCFHREADGSLVSSVKGIQIKIDRELLHSLFGVKTSGHSGVHSVNDEAKGLGIIGPGFKLKDGKLDINQIVDVSGAVVEKMGQSIRSRNLKKSGFSVQNGIWTKTSVAEGEAIIVVTPPAEQQAVAPAGQQQAEESPAEQQRAEESPVEQQRAEESPVEQQQAEESVAEQQAVAPAVQPESLTAPVVEEEVAEKASDSPTSIIGSILRNLVESALSTRMDSQSGEVEMEDAVVEGHIEESIPVEQSSAPVDPVEEEAPAQGEQIEVEEEAPARGEQSIEKPAPQRKGKRVVHRKFRQSHRKGLVFQTSPCVVPFWCEGRPRGIQGVVPFWCDGRPSGIQGVVPFWCEGRPGGIQGVVPFGCERRPVELGVVVVSLRGTVPLISEILRYCSGTGRRSPVERSSEPG